MPDLRAYVINCLIGGDTFTSTGPSRIRNIVTFNCAGKMFEFKQRDEVAKGQINALIGQCCDTSEVLVRDVSEADLKRIIAALDRLCWLLSFAGLSRITWYGYDYPADSTYGYRRSVGGVANHFRPIFDIHESKAFKAFVQDVFENYKKFEKPRRLNVVIDYLVLAEYPNQPLELKLLLAFVVLESLKDTYARTKSIPYIRGAFRRGPNASSPRYTFESLLRLMFHDVRMKRGLKAIVKLRNEIVHSGVSRLSHRSQLAIYDRTHDIIREYLLRLLHFRGTYLSYTSRGATRRTL